VAVIATGNSPETRASLLHFMATDNFRSSTATVYPSYRENAQMRWVLSAGIRAKTRFARPATPRPRRHDLPLAHSPHQRIFSRTDLTAFIEPQVMKPHERSRFERRKVRPQLGMPFVELNVRRLYVDRVLSETGQGLVRVLLAPAIGDAVHHFPKRNGIEVFLTIL
jgi:hypothetical protein